MTLAGARVLRGSGERAALRLDLEPDEMEWLRGVVFGDEESETRLLALVRGGWVVHAVRSDGGPLARTAALQAQALPAHAGTPPVDRTVWIDARARGGGLFEQLVAGSVRADPPWLAALEVVRRVARQFGFPMGWLLPDGVYGAIARGGDDEESGAACALVRGGRVIRIAGAGSVGPLAEPTAAIVERIRERLGAPQLVLLGRTRALRTVLESARPASALERASIRGALEVVRSRHLAATLLGLRLLGR